MGKIEEEFRKRIAKEAKNNSQGLLGRYTPEETELLKKLNQR